MLPEGTNISQLSEYISNTRYVVPTINLTVEDKKSTRFSLVPLSEIASLETCEPAEDILLKIKISKYYQVELLEKILKRYDLKLFLCNKEFTILTGLEELTTKEIIKN